MHEAAKKKIIGRTEGLLKSLRIRNGVLGLLASMDELEGLAQIIASQRKQWLNNGDAWSLVASRLFDVFYSEPEPERKEATASLWDFLGGQKSATFIDSMAAYVESIPRDYDLLVRLPQLSAEPKPIDLSKDFGIVYRSIPSRGGMLGVALQHPENGLFLRSTVRGYCSGFIDNPVIRRGTSNFKIAIHQLHHAGILRPSDRRPQATGFLRALSQPPNAELFWTDQTSGDGIEATGELPPDTSRFLNSLVFAAGEDPLATALRKGQIEGLFRDHLSPAASLMARNDSDSETLRSAIEWSFDSAAAENETIKFIQLSIGFEALLGEESESDGLSRTLADRCAFLIESNAGGRRTVRDRFIDFYKTRSKIVHGRRSILEAEQRKLLQWGTGTLRRAIEKELANLGS